MGAHPEVLTLIHSNREIIRGVKISHILIIH